MIKNNISNIMTFLKENKDVDSYFQKEIIKLEDSLIEHIQNPSIEAIKLAFEKDAYNLTRISSEKRKKIPDEILKIAINQNAAVMGCVENPSFDLQDFVVKKSINYLKYINNPDHNILQYCVENDPVCIEYIQFKYGINPELQMLAINRSPRSFQYIDHPCLEAQEYIIKTEAFKDIQQNHGIIHNLLNSKNELSPKVILAALDNCKNNEYMMNMAKKHPNYKSAAQYIKDELLSSQKEDN